MFTSNFNSGNINIIGHPRLIANEYGNQNFINFPIYCPTNTNNYYNNYIGRQTPIIIIPYKQLTPTNVVTTNVLNQQNTYNNLNNNNYIENQRNKQKLIKHSDKIKKEHSFISPIKQIKKETKTNIMIKNKLGIPKFIERKTTNNNDITNNNIKHIHFPKIGIYNDNKFPNFSNKFEHETDVMKKMLLMPSLRDLKGIKKYVCKCGRKFKHEPNLKAHARCHTNKAFVCQYCNKKFGRKCNYDQHLRVHSGEKPYKCNNCGKEFKQRTGCKDHIKRCLRGKKMNINTMFVVEKK